MRLRTLLLVLSLSASVALAHEVGAPKGSLDDFVVSTSWLVVIAGSAILSGATVIGIYKKRKPPWMKRFLFVSMVGPVLVVTGFLVSSTLYLNLTSWSGGPVHWHADYEVWVCGARLHLPMPEGFTNRVGTATVHEHGDDRIHIEGVVEKRDDASVGEFFEKVGGHLERGWLIMPTANVTVEKHDGDTCPDGRPWTLKFFVNNVSNDEFGEHVIAPYSLVPPGDFIKVVFDES